MLVWTGANIYLTSEFYRLDPKAFDIEDEERNQYVAREHFLCEVDTVDMVGEMGHGPEYLIHGRKIQSDWMPCPNRLIWILVTTQVPGDELVNLNNEQLKSTRTQLTHILE
jgi:hypothetical protein